LRTLITTKHPRGDASSSPGPTKPGAAEPRAAGSPAQDDPDPSAAALDYFRRAAKHEEETTLIRILSYEPPFRGTIDVLSIDLDGTIIKFRDAPNRGMMAIRQGTLSADEFRRVGELVHGLDPLPPSDSTPAATTRFRIAAHWRTRQGFAHWEQESIPSELQALVTYLNERLRR
jgi:hypothetical protein